MTGKGTYKRCIEYHRQYRKEHAEQRREYNRQWRLKHPEYKKAEKFRQYGKEYREVHSEESKEYMKKWLEQHLEYNAQRKQWRIEHPEQVKMWRQNTKPSEEARKKRLLDQAKWRKENSERVKIYTYIHDHEEDYPLADICEFCGDKERLVRHHPDYDYPEIYVTCCSMCHQWIHRVPIFYPYSPARFLA